MLLKQDPLNQQLRANAMQSAQQVGTMNALMTKLVKEGKYSDKGLNELRAVLGAKALAAAAAPEKAKAKESENKDAADIDKRLNGKGQLDLSAEADSITIKTPLEEETAFYTEGSPKSAADYVRERIKSDLGKSQLAAPTMELQNGGTRISGDPNASTTTILQKVDSLKPGTEVPQVSESAALVEKTGRMLYDPAGRGLTGNSAGISDTVPQIVDDETKQKIKLAAAEYLNKLAKAPDSKNPKDKALQMAIRNAQEDENVFDGLLNEVTDMLSNQAMLKVSTFTAGSMKTTPIQANPAFGGGRQPASLDSELEETIGLEGTSSGTPAAPGNTKVPVLIVLATLLAILIFWSSQPKPKKAPYVPKGKRPLPGQPPGHY